ncbi:MAG: hypothetical protein IKQ11_06230 [Paludibacteraceae bacterium]|nr:hypothetical protein [Paludibacteraceae bacterium]
MSSSSEDKIRSIAMYRRWAYMAVAIVAAILLRVAPVFSFQPDKGIQYTRSFRMDLHEVQVIQTALDTNVAQVWDTIPVNGLYVMQRILFWSCILCLLLFYPTRVRWYMTFVIMAEGAVFYGLLIYYALKISGEYATLAPTWVAFMPALIIAMMIALNRNVTQYGNYFDDIKVD